MTSLNSKISTGESFDQLFQDIISFPDTSDYAKVKLDQNDVNDITPNNAITIEEALAATELERLAFFEGEEEEDVSIVEENIDILSRLSDEQRDYGEFASAQDGARLKSPNLHDTRIDNQQLFISKPSLFQTHNAPTEATSLPQRDPNLISDLVQPKQFSGNNLHVVDPLLSRTDNFSSSNFSSLLFLDDASAANRDSHDWNNSTSLLQLGGLGEYQHSGELSEQYHNNFVQSQLPEAWSDGEIGVVVILAFLVPFILCSNLLVLISLARTRRLQMPTNVFLTSLASADILMALASPFVVVTEIFLSGSSGGAGGATDHGAALCLIPNRVLMATGSVSLLTLATIAYDRYTALVSPLQYLSIMTSRRVAILVVYTWTISVIVSFLPLAASWYDEPSSCCTPDLLHNQAHAIFLCFIVLPSIITILVCYSRILSLAHHHAQAIAATEVAVQKRLQMKCMFRDTKYAKTLALILGAFIILWMPHLLSLFFKLVVDVSVDKWTHMYLLLLAVLNSGVNPWIYAFKNKEFRGAIKRLYFSFMRRRARFHEFNRKKSLVSLCSSNSSVLNPRSGRASRGHERPATLSVEFFVPFTNNNVSLTDNKNYDIESCESNTQAQTSETDRTPHCAACEQMARKTENITSHTSIFRPHPSLAWLKAPSTSIFLLTSSQLSSSSSSIPSVIASNGDSWSTQRQSNRKQSNLFRSATFSPGSLNSFDNVMSNTIERIPPQTHTTTVTVEYHNVPESNVRDDVENGNGFDSSAFDNEAFVCSA